MFAALYPEIHYRFRYFPLSAYFRRRPEIIFDIPRRVESDSIPLLMLVKDSHLFPVKFTSNIKVELVSGDKKIEHKIPVDNGNIEQQWWFRLLELDNIPFGEWEITVEASYRCGGRGERKLINHNLPGLRKAPLKVNHSSESLPKPDGYILGDLHCHSAYTSDQVEFGAPLKALAFSAKSAGLDFAGITDHTYDMDDLPDDYLETDPSLQKWRRFLSEVDEINRMEGKFAHLLAGQEVTVANSHGRNVHLLLYGSDRLFPGLGDSAERWFETGSEYSIEELLAEVGDDCMVGAAHPWCRTPLLERLLVHRGKWSENDFSERVVGAQIANGGDGGEIVNGVERWRKLLDKGKQVALWGGNDSHGNFNRFRQVGMPMLWLRESGYHLLGVHRTGVYAPDGISQLWKGIERGATYISNGPGLNLTLNGNPPGSIIEAGGVDSTVEAVTSPECGFITSLTLKSNIESNRVDFSTEAKKESRFVFRKRLELKPGYVFAECWTDKGAFCITSAIFVE